MSSFITQFSEHLDYVYAAIAFVVAIGLYAFAVYHGNIYGHNDQETQDQTTSTDTSHGQAQRHRRPAGRVSGRAKARTVRTDGAVLGAVSFLARTFEVREIDVYTGVIIATEPGGDRLIVGEADWGWGYPGRVYWSPDPKRHALFTDNSRLKFALEQRVYAVIDRAVFGADLPPRFHEEVWTVDPYVSPRAETQQHRQPLTVPQAQRHGQDRTRLPSRPQPQPQHQEVGSGRAVFAA
ncbi:hypothetical protein [Salininema proteolyticum]|uniref:DUF4178 domain-containing protein n=1 Tax=Salininema proteolyticum TaxID=1607685 RepID=A0ABV8U1Q8_9ACTN